MNYRLRFMLWLYDWSQIIYAKLFKKNKEPWGISKFEFLLYPDGTLGKALGEFYKNNGFSVMPKLENHDAFHIITDTDTQIQDEIAMQYLLFGNGKLSLYMFAMIGIGTLLYPEFMNYYIRSIRKGRSMGKFHDIEFKDLLNHNLVFIKASIYSNHCLFI